MQSIVAASRTDLPALLTKKQVGDRRRRFGWRDDLVEAG